MNRTGKPTEQLLEALQERAKELNCLYRVDEILSQTETKEDEVFHSLLEVLPSGWQYPDICQAKITVGEREYIPQEYVRSLWTMRANIFVRGEQAGEIVVSYGEERPKVDGGGPFLNEEQRLIDAIAERIGLYILQRRLRKDMESWESAVRELSAHKEESWKVLLGFLGRTDRGLLVRITRKMVNHLFWNEIGEAEELLQEGIWLAAGNEPEDENRPLERKLVSQTDEWTQKVFEIAGRYLSEDEIVSNMQIWINEENSTFLIKSLENPGTGLAEISEAVLRFMNSSIEESELSLAVRTSLKVALLRRLFMDQLDYINVAKRFVDVKDFYELVQHLIYPVRSQGKLGGKGAGLFLAKQIVEKATDHADLFSNIKFPKTWYVASDAILDFIQHNNLNEVYNQKYLDIERVRQDYPQIIQVFKNSRFTAQIEKGLAAALDDFEGCPLIVRSSSILEDRTGASFAGKYKSLFLANQGGKRERLEALKDAIAEVYASVFSPDPIEYRAERGLIDFREEMGILIQEVVGTGIGKYFFPAFSGVGFSENEFRWSPRIRRADGLLRMVPGLGTRAVDRLSDDYPVLLSPGNPGVRVNVSPEEIVRYSSKWIDVINLDKHVFETVKIVDLLRECGNEYPLIRKLVSKVDGDRVRELTALEPDWPRDDLVVTFEGLISKSRLVTQMDTLLKLLREQTGGPVDIEFACNGEDIYIVQCRSQSHLHEDIPPAIPRDLPKKKVLFFTNRYVSNGYVPEISHIVYIDPEGYGKLSELKDLKDVGRIVGRLNKLLPKRQFILIGPGRWGSRGDIKLGVSVTYSDINNTAVLMEVAHKKGNYVPELSFGTHFFQDLVEANIRYLPIYPDAPGTIFQEDCLQRAGNVLPKLLPEFTHLTDTVKVIDVAMETGGDILRVLMNAELGEAVGVFSKPGGAPTEQRQSELPVQDIPSENHWRWRLRMAKRIAARLDVERFGVKALYVFGSTKNATAGPKSDINLIVHFSGNDRQLSELKPWLEGWSMSLAETNYLRTGYKCERLLDVYFVTDEDILKETSFAAKIGAVTDAAWPLPMGEVEDEQL